MFDDFAGVNPGGSKTWLLSVTAGTDFTGTIGIGHHGALGTGTTTFSAETSAHTPALEFGNNLTLGGALVMSSTGADTGTITLDHNVSFASVTLDGTTLANGTYSFSYLNANFDAIFNDGGSGSITVAPVPELRLACIGLLGSVIWLGKRRRRRADISSV